MDPFLYSLAASLIRRYGAGLLGGLEDIDRALIDKGADVVASAAVGGLIAWLKSRGRGRDLEKAATQAISRPDDEAALSELARVVEQLVQGAIAEFAALVEVAQRASSIEIENIRFGAVRAGVYVEGGATAHIGRVDVDIS